VRERLRDRIRDRIHSDEGMTLVELLVAMSILGIVVMAFLGVMGSVQRGFERQSARSQSNDQARLAVEEIDREIRSGNVLYDPASESDPANGIAAGMSLRVYTQSNGNIRTPSSVCVQWRIQNQLLERRQWATNWLDDPDTLVSPWHTVADHIMNRTVSPAVTAFTLDQSQAQFGSRIVKIRILANENPSYGQTVEIDESVTGRDTEFGYPVNICSSIPPY
jgi:prepilin-type N-terminal cleavage/methylation domain-containing protein